MRASRCTLTVSVLLFAFAVPARGQTPLAGADVSLRPEAAAAGGIATAFDVDGVPTFIWGSGQSAPGLGAPEAGARWHLQRFARAFKTSPAELSAARVVQVQQVPSGGVIVHFRQELGGLDVYGSDVKVLIGADSRLVAISGRPYAVGGRGPQLAFQVSSEEALATALSHLSGGGVEPPSIVGIAPAVTDSQSGPGTMEWFQLADRTGAVLADPAPVKPILFPSGGELVPAYEIQFYAGAADSNDSAAFRYIVAADDGRVIARRNLTSSEGPQEGAVLPGRAAAPADPPAQFLYRVWADPTGALRPQDGPQEDVTPHPTGVPDRTEPSFVPPNLVSMGGFNHPGPGAEPDAGREFDADRGMADSLGLVRRADPWLPADATETSGNNADAYVDHRAPDGLTAGDFRATTTAPQTFGRTYDTSAPPLANVDQSQAAVTQAFYTVNWLHDYWYGSGFNEAAGNAQKDNYGRGGLGGDDMRVEVQDNYFGGSRNNANMSTPSDGVRPRMQMFVWSGPETRSLTLVPGGDLDTGSAAFGAVSFDITAPVVLANDVVAPTTDACQPLPPVGPVIVLVDRGTCTFVAKAINVQAAGAVGMIVANNAPGPPPGLGGANPTITIAVLSISQADGAALKAALGRGIVNAHMFRQVGVERDSALDNQVIAHEWGHYLHHRLADCGSQQCNALSEGWGDFLALHMMSRAGDNLDGTYSTSVYAARTFGDSAYYGIRRSPYSVDFTKNGLTFKHISNGQPLPPGTLPGGPNSEVHNAGEVWTSMLWEGYVALQKANTSGLGFEGVRRRMADYVVAGLQMTPRDATYTEQRDAILAVAAASRSRRDDFAELAAAFAKRGAGSCAISPPRTSTDFVGVVESYELRPRIEIGSISLELDRRSCDGDDYLDAGEQGWVAVTVMNGGAAPLVDAVVTVSSATSGIFFPRGLSARIRRLEPFESTRVLIGIALDGTVSGLGSLELQVNVSSGEACGPVVSRTFTERINADDVPNASRIDAVETTITPWKPTGTDANEIWSRVEATPANRAWLGIDFPSLSDTALQSPDLLVTATDPLVLSFDHRHSFETGDGVFFDGGVIEVSLDGGATWQDISAYVEPGYGGTLFTDAGNPLGGRRAFVARNAGWPARDTVTLNLATALASSTVRVRFRIGTDEAAGDFGWEIDNISVSGISNMPFPVLVENRTACRP